MGDFWRSEDEQTDENSQEYFIQATDQSGRKQQITIRLDPGMITDARLIAARKGIGHHTLLRMWVMEGITRAYQEGLLEGPPRSWTPAARRGAIEPAAPARAPLTAGEEPAQRSRWGRLRGRREG